MLAACWLSWPCSRCGLGSCDTRGRSMPLRDSRKGEEDERGAASADSRWNGSRARWDDLWGVVCGFCRASGTRRGGQRADGDLHGHWIGLAMLLMVLGMGLDRLSFSEQVKTLLAAALLVGSFLFPLGVFL